MGELRSAGRQHPLLTIHRTPFQTLATAMSPLTTMPSLRALDCGITVTGTYTERNLCFGEADLHLVIDGV